MELLGDDVNGIYSNIAFVASDNTPETKEFNEEFTKRANMPPSFHSISTYDTVMLVCDAAIKCGDNLNRETLKDAIQSYKGFDGLMGPFEFTEDGAVYRGYKGRSVSGRRTDLRIRLHDGSRLRHLVQFAADGETPAPL